MARHSSMLLLAAVAVAVGGAAAAPVADALQRPAVMVKDASRAVLLHAARAGERLVAVGERGVVAVSDNGGLRWRQVAVPVSVTLTAVRFADARHGVAVGHGGTVLVSADGGLSWQRRLDGRQAAHVVLDGARAAGDPAQVRLAEQLLADGADKPLLDLVLFSPSRMLVVGAYGLALYSDDGGARWQSWAGRLPNPRALHLNTARWQGDTLVLAGEQGLVLQSRDMGATFQRVATPYQGSYFTAELPAADEIILGGLRGNAWRSTDGGATWAQLASPAPASITASMLAPDGSVLLANQAGQVLRVRGANLVPINRQPVGMPSGLVSGPADRVLAVGLEGVQPVPVAAR